MGDSAEKRGHKQMKRPWKVPFRKNRKLQSCLVLSLALHLLVIFGITHREQVTQYPVLPPIMLKFTKRPPPQRTLTRRQRPMRTPVSAPSRHFRRPRSPRSVPLPRRRAHCRYSSHRLCGCRRRHCRIDWCCQCRISPLGTLGRNCALGRCKERGRGLTRLTCPWN